jgi:mannose-6-phosphate isomerase-like protein (cupin superfamily)
MSDQRAGGGMEPQRVEPVVNLARKFAAFTARWSPKVVGQVNDVLVKVAKLEGEFPWHVHEAEDELFLVVRGRLRLQFRDGERVVGEGEFLVVPRGVEHRPVADEEVHVVLIEPAGTVNTGNLRNERTVEDPEWI